LALLAGARVLLAFGHPLHREILLRQFQAAGLAVEPAADAEGAREALGAALLAGNPFAAAVLDRQLPGGPGEALSRDLRQDPRMDGLALVMLSSVGHRGEGEAAQAAGFDAYLAEPMRERVLDRVLATAIERRRRGETGPLVTQHSVAAAVAAPAPPPSLARPMSVLLAEDNRVNQKIAMRMLKVLGVEATLAEDGFQVLAALEGRPFDLVLMDCQMPGMDGFVTTARIREREREQGGHLPIIAMTANALEGDREACLAAGMDDYISKPVNRHILWQTLSRWCG
jgi:CheY-like chemotaxis protein